MALTKNKLTDRTVRALKASGYHSDGDGLYLQISKTGAKSWIFRYRFGEGRRDMGLGAYEDVGLADARDLRDGHKRTLSKGVDPLHDRPSTPGKVKARDDHGADAQPDDPQEPKTPEPTLFDCWKEYVEIREGGWRGRKTKAGWMRSIESHAAAIKDKPVRDVDVDDVLSVVRPLWLTKAESAGKLRERLETVLDYAKVRKQRTGENPAIWRGNLVHMLPPRPKLQRGHMPALPFEQMPELMVKLANSRGMSARALEFTIYTVARETMTLEATWMEMSDDLWELELSRMKERPFRQPLSTGARAVLDAVRPSKPRPNQLVFPGKSNAVLSNMAMDMLLRDLAPGFTPHGMRSSFRDWAGDETDFARETIEECLAHMVGDETERAYRRGDALRKRRDVLEAWSQYCRSKLPTEGKDDRRDRRPGQEAFCKLS